MVTGPNTATPAVPSPLARSIVLVGLMGSGKSAIGRRLADHLGAAFVDTDARIEARAGMPVSEIFAAHGEAAFRAMEREAVFSALAEAPQVIAFGGGAYMDVEIRTEARRRATTIWLRAETGLLAERCSRNADRPLLHGRDTRRTLAALAEQRYPVYAGADITVDCADRPHSETLALVLRALAADSRAGGGGG